MYQKTIGIDIGKADFYVAIHGEKTSEAYSNDLAGFKKLYKKHKSELVNGLVVLEVTGGYEMNLIRFLQKKHSAVHRAHTRNVKHFIRSYGQLGKSDALDALALARYGYERQASLPLFVAHSRRALQQWVNRRADIKKMLVQEKNRLKAPEHADLKSSLCQVIKVLEKQIEKIDRKIKTVCEQDACLVQQKEVLKTLPGVGDIIAIQLLALVPELGSLNRKQVASLCGLAPHPNESGGKIGYRFTRGGRQQVKPVLFMAAMSASRSHSELGSFYQSKVAQGKQKMVALTALMRKIIVIANARVRDFMLEQTALNHS